VADAVPPARREWPLSLFGFHTMPTSSPRLFSCDRLARGCAGSFLLILTALAVGCGDQASYPCTRLTGTVAIEGKPVEQGSLSFTPEGPGPAQAVGASVSNGRYVADNVPLGKVRVLFNATRETGQTDSEHDKPIPIRADIVPVKYRSGVEIEVGKGQTEQNFELNTSK